VSCNSYPAVHVTPRGTLAIASKQVTDPAELAQMAIGPDEIAIEVPGSKFPEAVADASGRFPRRLRT